MSYGLSTAGLVAPRAADFLVNIEAGVQAELSARGLPAADFDHDLLFGILRNVLASELGTLGEALQAVYDSGRRANATGVHLDDAGAMAGITRNEATFSRATVTLTGTASTVITAGKLVQGGGVDGTQRWRLIADATIGGGGTVAATVVAEDAGAITAPIGTLTSIVTPVAGWTAVTNAAAATVGRDRETDAAFRRRQRMSLQRRGAGSANAIQGALLELDYVSAARVLVNPEAVTATVSGLSMAPHSISAILYPSTLTDDEKAEVAETLYNLVVPGIYTNGSTSADVTRTDGYTETVRWTFAAALPVTVQATVVLKPGYVLADVEEPIQELVSDWFAVNAQPGQDVTDSDIEAEIMGNVTGVRRVVVLLNGGTTVTPTAAQVPTVSGTPSVVT